MDALESILYSRLILEGAGLSEEARHRLAEQVELSDWMLSSTKIMVSSECQRRLWELAAHELGDPHVALRVASTRRTGTTGLAEYLLMTSQNLGVGFAVMKPYVPTVSTNVDYSLAEQTEQEISVDFRFNTGDGQGHELAMQYILMALLTFARDVTGVRISPVRVRFQQQAPRRHDVFKEMFDTEQVDFGAPTDQVTFRTDVMTLPLRTADPVLGSILLQHADAALSKTPSQPTSWRQRLHEVLVEMVGAGPVNVDYVARRMVTSRRSLQRRLAEEGTTWRCELDRARRAVMEERSAQGLTHAVEMARQLGFSDVRSLRRAQQRWSNIG